MTLPGSKVRGLRGPYSGQAARAKAQGKGGMQQRAKGQFASSGSRAACAKCAASQALYCAACAKRVASQTVFRAACAKSATTQQPSRIGTFSCVPRRFVLSFVCVGKLSKTGDTFLHGRWLKSRKRLLPCKGCAASVLRFASVAREPSRVPWRARLNSTFGFGARAATRAAQAHRASELAGRRARLEHTANFARTPSARRSLRTTSAWAA